MAPSPNAGKTYEQEIRRLVMDIRQSAFTMSLQDAVKMFSESLERELNGGHLTQRVSEPRREVSF